MELGLVQQVLPYLPHFAAIVRQKNLARAAQEMNVSAPAMTHALNKMEDILGVTLCVRNRSIFQLTPEGQEIARVAESIMTEMQTIAARLDQKNSGHGHLCIGVIDEFENAVFHKVLKTISSRFKEAFLSVVVLPSEEILARVSSGELDAGFGIFNERRADLKYVKIGEEHLHYYLSKDHPLYRKKADRDAVKGMSSVWIDNEARSRIEVENEVFQERANYRLKIRAFTNNARIAVKLVETGAFIAPLPEESVNHIKDGAFQKISISKGPMVLTEEFVFNPAIKSSWLKAELVKMI